MAWIETADGEDQRVEEHELPVTVYATVGPHSVQRDYEVGRHDYGDEHSDCVSMDLAEAVHDEYLVDVEDYGYEVVDLDDTEVTVL